MFRDHAKTVVEAISAGDNFGRARGDVDGCV